MNAARRTTAILLFLASGAALLRADPAAIARGRDLYWHAQRSDGRPIRAATGAAGVPLPQSFAACVHCHGGDARGRDEGGVRTSDIRGETLTKPYVLDAAGRRRPAYDAAAFFAALTRGVDSAGATLDPVMPRYELDAGDAADVRAYLDAIAEEPVPGVSGDTIRIGYWNLDGQRHPDEVRRDVALLRAFFARQGARGSIFRRRVEVVALDSISVETRDVFAAIANGAPPTRATDRPESPLPLLVLAAGPGTEFPRHRFALYARPVPADVFDRTLLAAAAAIAEALKNSGRELTRDSFLAGLEALEDFRTEFAPPIRFGPGRHVAFPAP